MFSIPLVYWGVKYLFSILKSLQKLIVSVNYLTDHPYWNSSHSLVLLEVENVAEQKILCWSVIKQNFKEHNS